MQKDKTFDVSEKFCAKRKAHSEEWTFEIMPAIT
jgi:hypothetical protein